MLKLLFNRKVNLVALILLTHLVFSYYYIPKFWSACFGFAIILLLAYLAWNNNFLYWIGFQLKAKNIVFSLLLGALFLTASYFLVNTIALAKNIHFVPGNIKTLFHVFFYTLNEEIILGALLLKGIKYYGEKLNDWIISIGVALFFALLHFVFFKWIFINSESLGMQTILTLFAVGILRNNLILKTGHIAYAWAVHFGWVAIMLGGFHLDLGTEKYLTDSETFELYLGDYRTLLFSAILAGLSFYFLRRKPTSPH